MPAGSYLMSGPSLSHPRRSSCRLRRLLWREVQHEQACTCAARHSFTSSRRSYTTSASARVTFHFTSIHQLTLTFQLLAFFCMCVCGRVGGGDYYTHLVPTSPCVQLSATVQCNDCSYSFILLFITPNNLSVQFYSNGTKISFAHVTEMSYKCHFLSSL